eukprot:CAMPEP_0177167214 /NCGR_PEP_ID=MMETSP0367-20130122/8434_1 /TAXON_ID=447022 ORGANISM="Scrippsiella hangoei-like, Strain SHHI-4" /NCGR_SAMPLE_ID=MMETSP0367 /ASSEMBLY_ACC=CAM_ASM_000362 /LENGTH=358 /DNA_ID=CAMNT_0018613307 /DNA_START=20 /DNA_END=1093 /DNA_ORIENTATION=+
MNGQRHDPAGPGDIYVRQSRPMGDDSNTYEEPSFLSSPEHERYLEHNLSVVPEQLDHQDMQLAMLRGASSNLRARGLRPSNSTASFASTAHSVRSSALSDCGTAKSAFSTSFITPAELSVPLPPLPNCFRCPINQEIMSQPVFAADGVTYERENILAYFSSGRRTSPSTGEVLSSLELLPNLALREAIESYMELHNGTENLQRDWGKFMAYQGQRAAQKLMHKQRHIHALKTALDQSDRRIQHLEVTTGMGKSAASNPSSASTECTSNTRTPPDISPVFGAGGSAVEPLFKSGPAPKTDKNDAASEKPAEGGAPVAWHSPFQRAVRDGPALLSRALCATRQKKRKVPKNLDAENSPQL